jgi:hypothetical protein
MNINSSFLPSTFEREREREKDIGDKKKIGKALLPFEEFTSH